MSTTIKQPRKRSRRTKPGGSKKTDVGFAIKSVDLAAVHCGDKPLYCKKHSLWYMSWLDECPICAGENMTPATKEK